MKGWGVPSGRKHESFSTSKHGWITRRWTNEKADFGATGLHRCSPGRLLAGVSAEDRILESDEEYFCDPELEILHYAAEQIYQPSRPHQIPIHSINVPPPTVALKWSQNVGGRPR
jgi:hypothetical protein